MGVRKVLGHQVSIPLVDYVLLAYDLDASSATGGGRLQDVHVLEVVHLSVIHPPLVVLWEDVRCRRDLVFFAVLSPLLLHISPHVGFGPQTPGVWEVVYLLVLVHVLKFAWFNQIRPHAVPRSWPVARCYKMEASSFQSVDNTVVNVSLRNFKS